MIDEIFRMYIKAGIIKIISSDNMVKVSISGPVKNDEPVDIVIKEDEVLDYFSL